MKTIFCIAAAALGLFIFAGCGSSSSPQVIEATNNVTRARGNAAIQTASYAGDCAGGVLNIGNTHFPGEKTEYDLSDLNFQRKEIYFSDNCQTQAFVVFEKGQVYVHGPSGAVSGALEEDFNFQSATVTLLSSAIVTVFNTLSVCGINDWAVNVERDVSAKAGQGICPGDPTPRTAPELVLVDNTNLYLGADTRNDASKGRPTQVDRSKTFKKQ